MIAQVGPDDSWMETESLEIMFDPKLLGQINCKQHIRGLALTICVPAVVRFPILPIRTLLLVLFLTQSIFPSGVYLANCHQMDEEKEYPHRSYSHGNGMGSTDDHRY